MLYAAPRAEASRNVLFIVVDDLRDWAGYAGGPAITPHIDALAAQSTRFRAAYAPAAQCLGTRTSILLGIEPPQHNVGIGGTNNQDDMDRYEALYNDPAVVSLPQVLARAGYHTAATGKVFHWPQPHRWLETGPLNSSNDLYDPLAPGPYFTFMDFSVLPEGETHVDQAIADWASHFVAGYDGEQPFFLAVGLNLPHLPMNPPQWAWDLYSGVQAPAPIAGDLDDEPPPAAQLARAPVWIPPHITQHLLVVQSGKANQITHAYLASISHTDAMVGQILQALAASPHGETTDVILWSDHGFHLGEKFHWQKRTFWEPSVRVPLLVRAPAYPPGDVTGPVSLIDLGATVFDLAGVAQPPTFTGSPLHTPGPVHIYIDRGRATVTGSVKTIDYDLEVPGPADLASYDLATDPLEQFNLSHLPGC